MKTDIKIYTDTESGVRLVVERDIPGHPRMTLYWGEEGGLDIEEINAAIHRLMVQAGIKGEAGTTTGRDILDGGSIQ